MPTILDLFDADDLPNRPFERTIQPDDPATLFRDLRDYVLPPEVAAWLTDQPNGFLHQYLASVNSAPDALCTWITGFFGSGKSHLLKVLAHLLCNTAIRDESGALLGATNFLCGRFGLGNLATLLTSQLQGKPLVVQMLNYARSEGRQGPEDSISYIILSHLERSLGRSAVPWIAQFEQVLEKNSQFEPYRHFVADTTAADGYRQEWEQIKHDGYRAYPLLIQGLARFLPRTYKGDTAQEAVRLAEKKAPDPEAVVRRLVAEAKAIHSHKGRLVVCLDEVRLYLGDKLDRITELQVLAEKVKSIGQGKVFLVVTGQEAPEDVDSRFHQPGAGIGILADRFAEKFRLSANNIDYVVCQRLLRKSADSPAVRQLKQAILRERPQLTTAACIRNAHQNPNGRFTDTEPAALEHYYPLLPYHVLLLQEVLTRLRSTGPSGGVVGSKERAILIIIRALFGEPGHLLLGAAPVGALVTFDRVYDIVEEELKGIHLNQRDQIAQLRQSGAPDAAWLASVAKTVLLVQQVARLYFRVTEEVVAAVLYPALGADPNAHLAQVKNALKRLSETDLRYLTQDAELGYRFLSETETRFEKVVAEQEVTDADRFGVLQEGATAALKKKFFKHEYSSKHGKRKFEVKVTLGDAPGRPPVTLAAGAHLELHVLTPAATAADPHWADSALLESSAAPQRLVWSVKDLGSLYETVDRIVRVRKALLDPRLNTRDATEQEQIETQRQKVERQAHDDDAGTLPSQLLQGLGRGTLVWNGDKRDQHGMPTAEDEFAAVANRAIKAVFTQFDHGSALVQDSDLREVLTWKNNRPKCVEKLELMDGSGKLLLDRPVLKAVSDLLRRPDHAPEEKRKGEALAADFDRGPYGWDEHVVRAALAALLRAGALVVHEGPVQVRTPTDPKAIEIFSGWNRFKKAVFEYVGELTPAQRQTATQALHALFDRAGEDAFEKIDRALGHILTEWRPQVAELAEVARATALPCLALMEELRSELQAIQEAPAGTQRIQAFLQSARQAKLARSVPAFKALREFRVSGALDQYQKVRNFVAYPATPFVQRIGGALTAQFDALRGNLGHAEFYSGSRWSAITQAYDALRQRYAEDYRLAHSQRTDAATAAALFLRGHRNFARLAPAEQVELLAPLLPYRCEVAPGALDEVANFVCTGCRTSADVLVLQFASLPGLQAQVIARLDALDRSPEAPPTPGADTLVFAEALLLAGATDIGPLTERLRQALSEALAKGKVTIDVRIHTRPEGSP